VASKRVDKLAGEFVTKMLAQAGVTKSAGSTAAYMPYAVGLAEAVVTVEKHLKQVTRQMGRLIDENGERINRLAASYGVYMGPSVPAERGFRPLDTERFRVGLVDQQAAPKMNGHSLPGAEDGPAPFPPQWHPETDGGL